MPRHQNSSYACGVDVPEAAVAKRVRPGMPGGNKTRKHSGRVSMNLSVKLDPGIYSDEEWSDQEAMPPPSVDTTCSEGVPEGLEGAKPQEDLDHWDVISEVKHKDEEWPSLQKSCDPDLLDYDLFETLSQVSDMTLGSWVEVEDCDSPKAALTLAEQQAASTWASRIGPSNGIPKAKTQLPWAGHLRPMPEEKAVNAEGQSSNDDFLPQARGTWTKWQKSSRNMKAVERRLLETERRQQQRRNAQF
eukprot:CAMPEP_0114684498 /NCGR_PEP_ID=MMETSP0191-20121206/59188_1 /TAXON_ID=126664 /ORGANISM="Sorites sp." /LENGTH=245 /DNA_ID=CAMNT_0001967341 /DNA_START=54 /DNA_END=790 /DNA_ORIENTATION=-